MTATINSLPPGGASGNLVAGVSWAMTSDVVRCDSGSDTRSIGLQVRPASRKLTA